MKKFWCVVALYWLTEKACLATVIYDTFTGEAISQEAYEVYVENNTNQYCALVVEECCANEGRRVDGSCNNLRMPSRGAVFTPYAHLIEPVFFNRTQFRRAKSGAALPKPRVVRTTLIKDGHVSGKKWTHLLNNLLLTLVGEVTSFQDTLNFLAGNTHCCQPEGASDPQCMPIEVPEDDPYLGNTDIRCINLTRSISYTDRGCVSEDGPLRRINPVTPVMDLSGVYGLSDSALNTKGRAFEGGRLKVDTSYGRVFLPVNDSINEDYCFQNVGPNERMCFDAPAPNGANGLFGSTLTNIWWWRMHNFIASHLEAMNPCWSDDELFDIARYINIAIYQQIIAYEAFPIVVGKDYAIRSGAISDLSKNNHFVDNYDDSVEPRVYLEFLFSMRWFHLLQESTLNRYSSDGKILGTKNIVFFTQGTGKLPLDNTIEELTQDTFRQSTAGNDYIIDNYIGELAFGVMQKAGDLASSDLYKNRDQGIAPYNQYRELCGLPIATTFEDLLDVTTEEEVERLSQLYEDVNDIDFQAGIWVERPLPGAVVGPTLACIISRQMELFRVSDRFWFEHPNVPRGLTKAQLKEVRKANIAAVLCAVADQVTQIQPHAFEVIGQNNKLVSCKNNKAIPKIDFSAWADSKCAS